jgi:hypothetical protein
MDAVGAASSIITLITAAIQSAKFIHQIIEGIKDAPIAIQSMAEKIRDLEGSLVRLQNVWLPQETGDRFERFMTKIQDC